MRTALEQELGLAAYFVSNEVPLEKGARNEPLESDAEKLSSTDNEDEELVTEGEGGRSASPLHLGGSLHLCRCSGPGARLMANNYECILDPSLQEKHIPC